MRTRKIIHLDADCFYAAVEMRDDPSLIGQPVAVGGPADRRGVIATCNYEARAFGVRSAMPTRHALRLCPNLRIIMPNFDRYKAASKSIFAIYRSYTSKVEPLSLDEAYLDVTDCTLHNGVATKIAADIRRDVLEQTGLTVSAGVAPNKFLAKIASDWHKPNGLFVIRPHQVDAFVQNLPVQKLFGVGPKTAERLNAFDIHTCADIRAADVGFLIQHFGKMGLHIHQLSQGIDNRAVKTNHHRKSISVETTFLHDLNGYSDCLLKFDALFDALTKRIANANAQPQICKAFIKLRLNDFSVRSIEQTCLKPAPDVFKKLLEDICSKTHLPIRLIGLGVRLQEATPKTQLSFLDA
jgi:DNA polymerase IV